MVLRSYQLFLLFLGLLLGSLAGGALLVPVFYLLSRMFASLKTVWKPPANSLDSKMPS
jgi:hypothetical protein